MTLNRRNFVIQSLLGVGAMATGGLALAEEVKETDAQATALGYKANATKVDTKKFPTYAAGKNCGGCALYQGKAGAALGGCALFAGKQVAAAGWCSAWSKKA